MGWIIALFMAIVAAVAFAAFLHYHRRELRRLRSSHKSSVAKLDTKYRRRIDRLDREHDRELQAAHHPLAQDLLPALDSLDEALAHLEDEERTLSPQALEEGLELARNSLYDALARHDITAIVPGPGEPFDPEIHEAIARTEDPDQESGTIRRLFRRGYRDDRRVLRSAMVEVNTAPVQSEESSLPPDEEEASPESSADETPTSPSVDAPQDDVEPPSDPPSGRVDRS